MKNFKTAKRLKITKQKKRWVKNRMCLSINVTQKWWKDAFTLFCPCMSVCLSFCSTLGYVWVCRGKAKPTFLQKNLKIYFYHEASIEICEIAYPQSDLIAVFFFFFGRNIKAGESFISIYSFETLKLELFLITVNYKQSLTKSYFLLFLVLTMLFKKSI